MSEILRKLKPVQRRWLKPLEKYRVTVEYESAGIDKAVKFPVYQDFEVDINPSDVVYLCGDSGSGKSVLLRWFKEAFNGETVDVDDAKPEADVPLVEQIGGDLQEALTLLSRAGLNDAFLFIRRFRELSEGQKFRFKVARMMESGQRFWVMDEFCSTLDRDTAKIVAFNVQKLARKAGCCVLAATCHTDLFDDLNPDVYVFKRFGKEASVTYHKPERRECSLTGEMRVEEGSYQDWKNLARFHYRSHRVAAPRRIFCLKRGDELCGVIVYTYPPICSFGRKEAGLPRDIKELNKLLSTISRVVVHPKYRTIGLGRKLVEETLPLAGTRYVELIAVIANYNPFAEKAGMKRVKEKTGSKEGLAIADVLVNLGFNIQMLASESYLLKRLTVLGAGNISRIKEAFISHDHPRFVKFFRSGGRGPAWGLREKYVEQVESAGNKTLAKLIKICGMLLQTKVYLFWDKNWAS